MSSKIKIYVASPPGFSETERKFYYNEMIPRIEKAGYKVTDPWTLTPIEKIQRIEAMPYGPRKRDAWRKLNMVIGENNKKTIDESDGLIAVPDGTDVGSGGARK